MLAARQLFASVSVVQRFSGGILCAGASYRAILAANLNSYGSVDVELPADFSMGANARLEVLTEIEQSPEPAITEKVLSAGDSAGSVGVLPATSGATSTANSTPGAMAA